MKTPTLTTGPKIVTILGGGSVWTAQLLELLAELDFTADLQIRLQGPTRSHLEEVATFVRQPLKRRLDIQVETDVTAAIREADIILCQARVGGWRARLADETLPVKLGGVGDESLGLGGVRAANRSLPFLQLLAQQIPKLAPRAWVLNLTNPCDLISRTLREEGCARVIGLCEHPQAFMQQMATQAGRPVSADRFGFFGITHVGWATLPAVLKRDFLASSKFGLDGWLREWHALPTPWRIHLSDPVSLVKRQRTAPGQRARYLMKLVERLRQAMHRRDSRRYRTAMAARDLPWYPMVVVPAIRSLLGGAPARLVVGLPNDGRFPGLQPEVQVEGWVTLTEKGAVPESCRVNPRCQEDVIRFGQTRDLAYAAARHPDHETLAQYVSADPFTQGVGVKENLEWLFQPKCNK